jgi:hypothetical protein
MAYFTKSAARSAATSQRQKLAKSATQILAEGASSASVAGTFDIFLSHSIQDADLVLGMKLLLDKQGFSVYVDWDTDAHLDRSTVSKETAVLLRTRMRQSKSLLYLATENAGASKWMPWELGYFDGLRNGGVAVLPLVDQEDGKFPRQEYLALYPVVTKDFYKDLGTQDVFVEDRGRWTTLEGFAKGQASWNKYS